jgi:hypothetical protein
MIRSPQEKGRWPFSQGLVTLGVYDSVTVILSLPIPEILGISSVGFSFCQLFGAWF